MTPDAARDASGLKAFPRNRVAAKPEMPVLL